MLYRHEKSGVIYRELFTVFNTETQRHDVVYMSMETGVLFSKDLERFHKGMKFISDPQEKIIPNPDQIELKFEE